jgi:hypothetical protein
MGNAYHIPTGNAREYTGISTGAAKREGTGSVGTLAQDRTTRASGASGAGKSNGQSPNRNKKKIAALAAHKLGVPVETAEAVMSALQELEDEKRKVRAAKKLTNAVKARKHLKIVK